MPELHIITGSNGAGKSSIGPHYLPDYARVVCQIFDGDKLFQHKKKELWKQGVTAIEEARNIAASYVNERFDFLKKSGIVTG